jgi:hypothetical protein
MMDGVVFLVCMLAPFGVKAGARGDVPALAGSDATTTRSNAF